jgi:hypothetical protein
MEAYTVLAAGFSSEARPPLRLGHLYAASFFFDCFYKTGFGLRRDYNYRGGEIITFVPYVEDFWRPLFIYSSSALTQGRSKN